MIDAASGSKRAQPPAGESGRLPGPERIRVEADLVDGRTIVGIS